MACAFCGEISNPHDNQYYHALGRKIGVVSRVLMETDNWYAIPSLGCLATGYVLLVCKRHFQSLANLNEALYGEMLDFKRAVEAVLWDRLGLPCLAFEHGVTAPGHAGANSVDHVHLHMVPFPHAIWREMAPNSKLEGFCAETGYESLFAKWKDGLPNTYLLFQDADGALYYKPDAAGMPSQLFRKCLAPYFGTDDWDWRLNYFQANFIKTLELFDAKTGI